MYIKIVGLWNSQLGHDALVIGHIHVPQFDYPWSDGKQKFQVAEMAIRNLIV